MPALEFITRLAAEADEERWLVRPAGGDVHRIALLLLDPDRNWLATIERLMRSWIGFHHPRVTRLFGVQWLGDRLVLALDDDRGPTFANAAAQLADTPEHRERWAIAQIIAIADGLAAMARHANGFIYRRIEPTQLFVDPSGHARLRAAPHEGVKREPSRCGHDPRHRALA